MFKYVDGELSLVNVSGARKLADLAREHGDPLYVYDKSALTDRVQFFMKTVPRGATIHYAMKANNHHGVLQCLREQGIGLDVVSGGELDLGLRCGFTPESIVFSGVGKSITEIELALNSGILQINVESLPELSRVAEIAKRMKVSAPVALRINPDVDADTHPYIRTGFRENKFGIDMADIPAAFDLIRGAGNAIQFNGLTLHIGSQIQDMAPFVNAISKTVALVKRLQTDGIAIRSLDFGGGVGIDYHSDDISNDSNGDESRISAYGKALNEAVKALPEVVVRLEPGRILVARAGALLGRVEYVKRTPHKNFVILNTGMHHLLRPSLYQAFHRILPCRVGSEGVALETFDVVGPICESTDVLGHDRRLPAHIKSGDLLAIMDAGAYGAVMMSDYNCHERAKEVLA